ncbi:MAG: hypothetical protein OXU77_13130 [Gammaproteobacteria bacterium]|nr:hypothetical protein [Gammaproteobacteria bacterium]MDE0442096.1 hypothetical protein [Gammaproteobacteria bacterium]
MSANLDCAKLGLANRTLRTTGRGKHVGGFSYYHVDLVVQVPAAWEFVQKTRGRFKPRSNFNVVRLSHSRLSFLLYERFSVAFPALRTSLFCDLASGASRFTDFSRRPNPPILHRKELLLPADDPLVPGAVRLTQRLEGLGAFRGVKTIGTREGWRSRLAALGLTFEEIESWCLGPDTH